MHKGIYKNKIKALTKKNKSGFEWNFTFLCLAYYIINEIISFEVSFMLNYILYSYILHQGCVYACI